MTNNRPAVVGLIGFGTLARQTVDALKDQPVTWVVLLREGSKAAVPAGMVVVRNIEDLADNHPRIVVEAAGQASVSSYVPSLLRSGIPVVVASVGALADEQTAREISQSRTASGARLVIPSGAIGGLDYLAAVARLPDTRVRYVLRKPVAAWQTELSALGLSQTKRPVTLFEGTPEEAARHYPRNLNAAYTAALTVSPTPVTVTVIADPGIELNIHELEVESAAGTATFRFANTPSATNPRTSAVTALSLAAAVRCFFDEEAQV
jgi:aspartate dehydrogenase